MKARTSRNVEGFKLIIEIFFRRFVSLLRINLIYKADSVCASLGINLTVLKLGSSIFVRRCILHWNRHSLCRVSLEEAESSFKEMYKTTFVTAHHFFLVTSQSFLLDPHMIREATNVSQQLSLSISSSFSFPVLHFFIVTINNN